jgi:aquaporin Z
VVAELIGTGLLVGAGLSVVIFDFGRGSPLAQVVPSAALRRAITGFLFGMVGATIAFSQVGRISGSHINPVVTISFWLRGKITAQLAAGYILGQMVGATVGAAALLAWREMGRSVAYGATVPGPAGAWWAVAGETGATFCLVVGLFAMLGSRRLRPYAPWLFPPLYGLLVWLEGPLSGSSTNPARSLGPALISADFRDLWVYFLGPLVGTGLALAFLRLGPLQRLDVDVAKLHHFADDPHHVLHSRR